MPRFNSQEESKCKITFRRVETYNIEEACAIIGKRLYKKDFAWIDIESGDYSMTILPFLDKEKREKEGVWDLSAYRLHAFLNDMFVESPSHYPVNDYSVLESAERFMKDLPIFLEIQFFD